MTERTPLRLAVVGDPIAHSRSPEIQRAALAEAGLAGTYEAIRADADEFEELVAGIRRGDLDGCNVTMPHKRLAARLMDRLAPSAERAQSVNTIVRTASGLVGHSTDVTGLARLWERDLPLDRPVLVLGTGGAAAAAAQAATGTSIYVAGRRRRAVEELTSELGPLAVGVSWGTAVADAVVVNATPLGMQGEPLPGLVVELASALCDLAYGDHSTPAVAAMEVTGRPVIDGIDVLVAQAADSFRLWTGRSASERAMRAALENTSRGSREAPNE